MEAEVVAEPVEEPAGRADADSRRGRGSRSGARPAEAGGSPAGREGGPLSGMAALEDQLKRELRMMAGGSGGGGAPARSGRASRGGFIHLFDKRD